MTAEERVERTIRCPRGDGRAVARIVVREGTRYLDIVGGRAGHLAGVAEFIGEQSGQPAREVIPAEHRLDLTIPASSTPLDDSAREMNDYLGRLEFRAVCPRCHVELTLAATFAFGKWNVVLRS